MQPSAALGPHERPRTLPRRGRCPGGSAGRAPVPVLASATPVGGGRARRRTALPGLRTSCHHPSPSPSPIARRWACGPNALAPVRSGHPHPRPGALAGARARASPHRPAWPVDLHRPEPARRPVRRRLRRAHADLPGGPGRRPRLARRQPLRSDRVWRGVALQPTPVALAGPHARTARSSPPALPRTARARVMASYVLRPARRRPCWAPPPGWRACASFRPRTRPAF